MIPICARIATRSLARSLADGAQAATMAPAVPALAMSAPDRAPRAADGGEGGRAALPLIFNDALFDF